MSVINNGILLASEAAGAGGYEISRSLRFNSADSAYLSRTPASAGNRKTWTWAGWVKRSKLGSSQPIFSGVQDGNNATVLSFNSSDYIEFYNYTSGYSGRRITSAQYRDPSAWYHIVLIWDSDNATAGDQIRLYVNGIRVTNFGTSSNPSSANSIVNSTNGHYIGADVGFNNQYSNQYLADVHFLDGITPGTATDDANGSVTGIPNAQYLTDFGEFDATTGVWNPIEYTFGTNPNNGTTWATATYLSSTSNYPGYPVANGFDGSTSTEWLQNTQGGTVTFSNISIPYSSTVKIWVGGSGATVSVNGGAGQSISNGSWVTVASGSGTLTSLAWTANGSEYPALIGIQIDGYTLISGADDNSFHLTFSDNSGTTSTTLGKDAAGSNNWTPNNFSVAAGSGNDSLVDVPQNGDQTDTGIGGEVRGNYCTWNPLSKGSNVAISNGNLDSTNASTSGNVVNGTMAIGSGKYYWEYRCNSISSAYDYPNIGINSTRDLRANSDGGGTAFPGYYADEVVYMKNGQITTNSSVSNYGSSFTSGDIISIAIDADNGAIYFAKNGTWQNSGVPTSGASRTGAAITWTAGTVSHVPSVVEYSNSSGSLNTGQRAFAYTAPSGFKALCTANLPTPTIEDGSAYMDVKLYTGNGSTQTISGLGFSPDWVWLKKRSGLADHYLYDQVRGATYRLYSNTTDAESTSATGLTAFTSDGFSLGSANDVNQSSNTYAAWCWDAGSSTVSNTQGSITSSVRANASAGFSIVTYTGTGSAATVGHGLGVAPSMIIVKNRSSATSWGVGHTSPGWSVAANLDNTNSFGASIYFNSTAPTSTVFSVGASSNSNGSGNNIVAYCFAPVASYSAFGTYTGNGSSDGPFVYTGFRPRWLLVKSVNYADTWVLIDAAREPYNVMNTQLRPNSSNAESVAVNDAFDFLSNGFKIRGGGAVINTSAAPFIYAAFAENPFKYSRAR